MISMQVFRVAKSISHHARFRSTMVSGGGRLRPQEDSLSNPIDMVVGTPGRVLQHIQEGNMVFGDIRYLVCIFLKCSGHLRRIFHCIRIHLFALTYIIKDLLSLINFSLGIHNIPRLQSPASEPPCHISLMYFIMLKLFV